MNTEPRPGARLSPEVLAAIRAGHPSGTVLLLLNDRDALEGEVAKLRDSHDLALSWLDKVSGFLPRRHVADLRNILAAGRADKEPGK